MHTGVLFDVPLNEDGKHKGFISIPFSIDRSPYYQIKIPVCRIKNGKGSRLLLMAGNHGDEYEGELCLNKLVRLLQASDIQGEVTIIPFLNMPAVMAAKRCSPLDNENLNRCFPGDASGSPSKRLAHFLEHALFPQHDVIFDIHSGGTTMGHLPTVLAEEQQCVEKTEKINTLLRAMGLEYGFIAKNGIDAPTSMGAAARAGALGLSGEFGGGGAVTPTTLRTLEAAIDNLLLALQLTDRKLFTESNHCYHGPLKLLRLSSHDQSIFSHHRGWFEPAVDIGDQVQAGQTAGWLHDFSDLETEPKALRFKQAGVVISKRLNVDCELGDCLMQVGVPD
ncbi:deacylase [Advenella sp. S44]|uniref:succinylglutamate desuccinylase/aspartoacylase domain-containing protein n=1 Tax=Advenella sp. S44 TaxID=1982755 RepID=UPI000C29802F|nr:succinylglutamate desuccinylase/aspartoacylase family protein [Advenella sp. S44]PJX21043.1 deacylase [Advenella sp. S44]